MTVVCLVAVAFIAMNNNIYISKTNELVGKVTGQSALTYNVDFSKDESIKKLKLIGDYSKVLVNKNNCVILNKEK